ncbi:MAG: tRNA-dihydrouridine synthase family protein [Bdellovibrionales bacterium]|nr:tRNA-dihydrouridine synthase family protein [Bdellovibrionales bacterium]
MEKSELQQRIRGALFLAPLTKGGNLPFRRLCVENGADITVSEMVYSRQLVKGQRRERALLRRHPSEKCFGVQIAVRKPEDAIRAGEIVQASGADFLDINCGCPIDGVTKKGLGASLLQKPKGLSELVSRLVQSLQIPVTVKIRTGWKTGKENFLEIAQRVQDAGAAALAIHGRTKEQRYSKAADWEAIQQVVESLEIPVVGNGDILTPGEAQYHREFHGVTSLMLARGALIKPWLFTEIREGKCFDLTPERRIEHYFRFVTYLKEHFYDDELGRKRIMGFLPWHFSFFARYRFFHDTPFEGGHPLIHDRLGNEEWTSPLDRLLRSGDPHHHEQIASCLVQSENQLEATQMLSDLSFSVTYPEAALSPEWGSGVVAG